MKVPGQQERSHWCNTSTYQVKKNSLVWYKKKKEGKNLSSKKKKNSLVWYKKKKEGKNTLSKSERRTVLLLASFIPG